MIFFSNWRKRRAIIKYRTKLGRRLARDYGASNSYLPAQVEATIVRAKLSLSFMVYALAMYCEPDKFDLYAQAHDIELGFDDAHDYIAKVLSNRTFGYKHSDITVSRESTYGQGGIGGGE